MDADACRLAPRVGHARVRDVDDEVAPCVLNYRRPIAWPATLRVHLSCTRLGNTSITLAHRIVDASDDTRLYCDGHVVMVWMDPATGKPVGLPASIRAAATPLR